MLKGVVPFGNTRRDSRVPKMLPHRIFPSASFCVWVDGKLRLNLDPEAAVERHLVAASAEFAALRNLRRETIDHEYGWICSWLCPGSSAAAVGALDEPCAAVRHQWELYAREQAALPGWHKQTAVIEGALLLVDLRSRATQCLLCNWFNEYARFGERDQLSFAYVLHVQRPRPRVNLLPRRLHWSVTVEDDTTACYNASEEDAAQLAVRFQHGFQRQAARRPASRARVVVRSG